MKEKTILKWLEKLFIAEIDLAMKGRNLPLQLPQKQAKEMIGLGLVEEAQVKDGPFFFKFHFLTHVGRFKYCDWASRHCVEED